MDEFDTTMAEVRRALGTNASAVDDLLKSLRRAHENEVAIKQREIEKVQDHERQLAARRPSSPSAQAAAEKLWHNADGRKLIELAHQANVPMAERLLSYLGHHVIAGELRDRVKRATTS